MRKLALFVSTLFVVAIVATLGGLAPAGAGGGTTQVFAVHGLNLNAQTAQADGGSNVTVCLNDTNPALIPDFEFGQVVGPVEVATGASINLSVYDAVDEDCENPAGGAIIDQDIASVPAGTVALVATGGPASGLELLPIALDTECADPGTGRLTAAHAANAGEVDVLAGGASAGLLTYGQTLDADLPAGTVAVQVDLSAGGTIVPSTDIPITAEVNRIVYVVGNQNVQGVTPVVPLVQDLAIPACEVATPPTTAPPPPPAPPAVAVTAQPSFTG